MKNKLTISVCMTVFSYSKYLNEQLESIIHQTEIIDELIIIEDYSGAESPREYIEKICHREHINLIYKKSQKNLGPAASFRQAISISSGDIIFLSDHDDIWSRDRIKKALPLHHNNDFVVTNGVVIKSKSGAALINHTEENKIYDNLKISLFNLILKNNIIGATISLRGDTARFIASKLGFYPMHDWILIVSFLVLNKKIKFIDESLIQYRRYDGTFTGNRKNSFLKKCKYRLFILYTILKLFIIK